MKKLLIGFLALQFISVVSIAQLKVQQLLTENRPDPIGLDIKQPRFSWQLVSDKRNTMQTAYELRVGTDRSGLTKGRNLVWNTGKLSSDQSVHVPYKGAPLEPDKNYYWQVRVWDNNGKTSAWSEPAVWHTAFFQPSDWKASWIEPGFEEDSLRRPSPLFRKQFSSNKNVRSATAYITAHGIYEAFINGKRVGNDYLTPGWTSYNKRLQYQVYDVTDLVKTGANAVGVMLGSGWYRGFIGFTNQKNYYGKDIALLFQLNIQYTDGSKESVISDGSWKSSTAAVRGSELYHGEHYDARLEKSGWTTANFNDGDWSGVKVADHSKDVLIATYNEPIKKQEVFNAIKIFKTPKNEQVIDFGQNLVGWVQLKVNGSAGDTVFVSHAEILDKHGNFYTENLRAAHARDTFILRGGGEETFEPKFTFHGFRFVKMEGLKQAPTPQSVKAIALYSDMKKTGSFTSSHPLINQLQKNIEWGQKGNFLDVPTDCPQRDERLGWTGDAQVFARTATFNMNVNNFFAKWLKDVEADQDEKGSVPFVVPDVLGGKGSAGWADLATIGPWTMYLAYGDKKILEDQYPSMKAWVNYMKNTSKNDLWNSGFHFGDWLFYRPEDDNDGRAAVTNKYLIAQCFFAHSTQLVINAARVLGKQEDVAQYSDLLQKVKAAFLKEYATSNGGLVSGTQTAYTLALQFDMFPEDLRKQAAQRLVDNIKSYDYHLTTGFLGTPYLCHVLTRFGHTDVAYRLLLQETYPSWLYPVKMGATTIWERWDGIRQNGDPQTPGMNSYNHYAYGAIGDWMYRVITGIDTDEKAPGYKQIVIKPHPNEKLTHAEASLDTYYGRISSSWKTENGKLTMQVEIPANTKATVYVPVKSADALLEAGKPVASQQGIEVTTTENGYVGLKLGSGKYQFSVSN
jgi:alpha-L-rhamnosidase